MIKNYCYTDVMAVNKSDAEKMKANVFINKLSYLEVLRYQISG